METFKVVSCSFRMEIRIKNAKNNRYPTKALQESKRYETKVFIIKK